MRNLLPIGRFSQVTRLTVKALRHYDELGLLRPAHVDRATGYRYYSLTQAAEAERIAVLRSLEMPLEQVREVLGEKEPSRVRALLDAHRQQIERRLAEHARALALLQRLIAQEEIVEYQVTEKALETQFIVSIRAHTSLARIGELFGRSMGELFGYLSELAVRPVGPPFSIYHDPDFKEDDVDVEIAVPVERRLMGRGRIQGCELSAGQAACTLHSGPHDQVGPAYRALAAWMQANDHEPAGPPREIYLVGPGQVSSPNEYRTELVWPFVATRRA